MLKQTLNMMELEVIFGREHTQLSRLQYNLIERLYGLIRSYSLKKRWIGSNFLDRINQSRRKRLLSMATRLAILARGRSRTRFLIICFILNRQVFFNDVNWLSDIPNPQDLSTCLIIILVLEIY